MPRMTYRDVLIETTDLPYVIVRNIVQYLPQKKCALPKYDFDDKYTVEKNFLHFRQRHRSLSEEYMI